MKLCAHVYLLNTLLHCRNENGLVRRGHSDVTRSQPIHVDQDDYKHDIHVTWQMKAVTIQRHLLDAYICAKEYF